MTGQAVVTREGDADRLVLSVIGDVDSWNALEIEREVTASPSPADLTLLDLSGVVAMDSAAVRLVHRLVEWSWRLGLSFEVVAAPGSVARTVLDMTATQAMVAVHDTLPDAPSDGVPPSR